MIEVKEVKVADGVYIEEVEDTDDYLVVRRLIANNFERWTVKQKLAIVSSLFEEGLDGNKGDGSV